MKRSPLSPTPMITAIFLALVVVLAGCGSGGGGSGGSSAATGNDSVRGVTVEARLAWAEASGPVAGYRVYVERNGGASIPEQTVGEAAATIEGEAGDEVRIRVAAISNGGQEGPSSPPSPLLLFTDGGVVAAAEEEEQVRGTTSTRNVARHEVTEPAAEPMSAAVVLPGDKAIGDFDGDGAADLLWEQAEPGVELRLATLWDDTIVRFERPEGSWWVASTCDLDGDGLTDILWQNAQGFVTYTSLASLLSGQAETEALLIGTLTPEESLVSVGDFVGDGTADLLTLDAATGLYHVWLRDEFGSTERVPLDSPAEADSRVVATGDYDGDGRTDVLWKTAEGLLEVGYMDGEFEEAWSAVVEGVPMDFVADGDFDADGVTDLAVRSAGGGVEVLLLGDRAPARGWARMVDAGAGWQAGDAQDFDGDGSADLVWTHETQRIVRTHPVSGAAPVDVPIDSDGAWVLVTSLP